MTTECGLPKQRQLNVHLLSFSGAANHNHIFISGSVMILALSVVVGLYNEYSVEVHY